MKNFSFMRKMAVILCGLMATTLLSAQAVGDVFAVDNINYTVTSVGPNEAEVSSFEVAPSESVDLVIPATATDASNSTDYSVTAVGTSAFENSTVISKVTLPTSVITLGLQSFNNSSITEINLENVVTISKKSFGTCLSLVDVGGVLSNCTFIGDYAFNQCFRSSLTIEFPVLETMGTGSIYNSNKSGNSLSVVNIPSTLTKTGTLFLGGHTALQAVQVNWSDTELKLVDFGDSGNSAKFFRWLDLSTITLYVNGDVDDSTAYADHALWGGFDNIVLGTLPAIGEIFTVDNIMYNITDEEPNEVSVVGFADPANATTTLEIPASVTYSVNSKDYSVVSVGSGAFAGQAIISASLPSSVTAIEAEAFKECRSLQSINLSDVVTIGDAAFQVCDAMTSTGELSSLTTLGKYGFMRCNKLTTLETPVLETIADGNMYTMSLFESYNIPSSVTSIGKLFMGTFSLTKYPFNVSTVQVNWMDTLEVTINSTSFFRNIGLDTAKVTLYVPVGTEEMYEAHSLWGQIPDEYIIEGVIPNIPTVIEELTSEISIRTSKGMLTVLDLAGNENVTVFDMSGRQMTSVNATSSQLEINLASGIYIVKVSGSETSTQKVFVQ